jgi:hypothetical protein
MKRCLGVVVNRGRIANLQVSAAMDNDVPGRVDVASTYRDVGTGQVVTTYATPGGG